MRIYFFGFVAVTALVVSSCAPAYAKGEASAINAAPAAAPDVLHVPLARQSTPYTCGAASTQALLYYWRSTSGDWIYSSGEGAIHESVRTTEQDGSEPTAIATFIAGFTRESLAAGLAQGLGESAIPGAVSDDVMSLDVDAPGLTDPSDGALVFHGASPAGQTPLFDVIYHVRKDAPLDAATTDHDIQMLRDSLAHKEPVILDLQAWRDQDSTDWSTDWDDGHYVVLIGMDTSNIYVMDPSSPAAYAYVPIDEFLSRWHDAGTTRHGPLPSGGAAPHTTNEHYQHMAIFVHAKNAEPAPDSVPLWHMD